MSVAIPAVAENAQNMGGSRMGFPGKGTDRLEGGRCTARWSNLGVVAHFPPGAGRWEITAKYHVMGTVRCFKRYRS